MFAQLRYDIGKKIWCARYRYVRYAQGWTALRGEVGGQILVYNCPHGRETA
jgi:hypothetical protein